MPDQSIHAAPAKSAPVLGIDIGGTKLAIGVIASEGRVLAEAVEPSRAEEGPAAMIGRAIEIGRRVLASADVPVEQLAAVGIACGGPLDSDAGIVLNALNNPGWVDIPIVALVGQAFDRPTFLDNDANAAAMAEHRFGAGRGVDDMVYMTVSTGMGSGVISGGRLLRGANGNAAELGHISIDYRGKPCHCGGIGCLEAYVSGTNIARRAGLVDAQAVVAAVRSGDPMAKTVWDETVVMLAAGVASIINAFNPRRVVIGGGVAKAGDLLFEPLRRAALGGAMPQLAAGVDILPAALGDRAGMIGAALVAREGLNKQARND